jgi:acetolactate synthase-1/2/3 large subunit
MLEDPELIGLEMDMLIASAMNGRKGPVWLDVPLDLQSMQIDPISLKRLPASVDSTVLVTDSDVKKVISWLSESKSPLILLGHGTRSANAITELRSLVSQTDIPLIFTASGVDIVGSGNLGSIGSIGMMGCSRSAAQALQEADLLIILGSRMNSMITGPNFDDFARKSKVVLVDIDAVEHSKPGRKYDLHIKTDIKYFLEELNSKVEFKISSNWKNFCETLRLQNFELEEFMSGEDGVDLYQMANMLSRELPDEGVLVTDSGFIELILPTNINFKLDQRCLHPISQGAMGYALPAAIGAHYASGREVFSVIGDGSIMMNIQEFQTISHNNIPIIIIVVNNNAYAIIRKRQIELFRGRTIGTDNSNGLSCPNFEEVAKCFKIQYLHATTVEEFESAFDQAKKFSGPILIEVQGVSNQEYIQMARGKNSEGKLVQMPIENQFPFVTSRSDKSELFSIAKEAK